MEGKNVVTNSVAYQSDWLTGGSPFNSLQYETPIYTE